MAEKIYVVVILFSVQTLFRTIRDKVRPGSTVYTDSFGVFDVLGVSEFHHVRINHSDLLAESINHIKRIEILWNQTSSVWL